MKYISVFCLFLLSLNSYAQVELNANGPGNTYDLITSVLAPGYNPIEVPDCSHNAFGDHIDEIFDTELNTNVFRFFIHTETDNDRCINFDRQRNEIKTYDQSPDNLLGVENETVVYKWKFKLADGFQSSPNFTHIHQLKSVGGTLASMPMYTLTTRKGTPDKLQLRYAETDSQVTIEQVELAPFIGTWLDVTETITYGTSGTYSIIINRVSDNATLLSYTNNNIINWRAGADFVRPKWGIYRSLINDQDLRDETVLFANFSIQEIPTLSTEEVNRDEFVAFINTSEQILHIKNIAQNSTKLELLTIEGRQIIQQTIKNLSETTLDISSVTSGTYIVKLTGEQGQHTKLIVIPNN